MTLRTQTRPAGAPLGRSSRPTARGSAHLGLALLVGLTACSEDEAARVDAPAVSSPPSLQTAVPGTALVVTLTSDQAERLAIRTVGVKPGLVDYTIELPGTVGPSPDFYAQVSSPIAGRVASVLAHEGEAVRRGQLLAELESLELANLVADVLQAQAERDYQAQQVERFETLVERKIRPASTLEKARADLARAEALLAASHARVHAIGVMDDQLEQWGSSDASPALMAVRSPIDGIIADHGIDLGQSVTANQTMLTLIDPAQVLIQGFLAPDEADAVRAGDPVRVQSQSASGRHLDAQVGTVNPSLASGNRSVTLNILVDTPDGWPIPGQSVNLQIGVTSGAPVIAVPLAAVEFEGEQATVFVRRDPLNWERRPVGVGRMTGVSAFITSGLAEGEEVAISQVFTLKALARFEQYGESEDDG